MHMVVQRDDVRVTTSTRQRWPDLAAGACAVLALCAIVIVVGESLLENPIAECLTSRAVLVDRMITVTFALATLALAAGLAAIIGRSERWLLATSAICVAALAGWIAVGGYQCFTITP